MGFFQKHGNCLMHCCNCFLTKNPGKLYHVKIKKQNNVKRLTYDKKAKNISAGNSFDVAFQKTLLLFLINN